MNHILSRSSTVFFFLLLNLCASSQDKTVAPAGAKYVNIDLAKHLVNGDIPFDQPFVLTGDAAEDKVEYVTFELIIGLDPSKSGEKSPIGVVRGGKFYIPYDNDHFKSGYLLPERKYVIKITAYDSDSLKIADLSFNYGFYPKTKLGDYTKLDFGLGYSPNIKGTIGYTSVHFFFTAINDEADLQDIKGVGRNVMVRANVYMGIAPLLISSDTKQPIKNRFALGNFIYGLGIRSPFYGYYRSTKNRVAQQLLQTMHLNMGQMVFNQLPGSTLITREVQKTAFYIGISYDLNIASILGPVTKLVSP